VRSDHHKLICERERHGSKNKYHDVRHRKDEAMNDDFVFDDNEEGDELVQSTNTKKSMTKTYRSRWIDKELSNFTTPINGFVRKNVGRKWDDVFSDFCSMYDQRSVLTKPLFQHLLQNIERKVIVKDNELYVQSRYGCRPVSDEFYVDPRDGILKLNKDFQNWRQRNREQLKAFNTKKAGIIRVVDNLTEIHLIDGTWFEIKFEISEGYPEQVLRYYLYRPDRPPSYYTVTKYPYRFDVLLKSSSNKPKVAISKRTLSKKEMRDYGLRETIHKAV
jgi:hypothetical protein